MPHQPGPGRSATRANRTEAAHAHRRQMAELAIATPGEISSFNARLAAWERENSRQGTNTQLRPRVITQADHARRAEESATEQVAVEQRSRGAELLAAGSRVAGAAREAELRRLRGAGSGVPGGGARSQAGSGGARAAEQRRIGLRTAGGSEFRGRGRGARLTSGLGMPARGKTLLG